jgi:hypothetical protein
MADETTRFDADDAPAPSLRITRPDQLTPLILDLADPAQRTLGDYELLEMIGQGGMGIVYRARQRSLDRIVAVKLIAGSSFSPEFVARFQSEAQRAARMQHPNIVTIHEIGATDRFSYFSMQLVEGETMADRLRRDGRMAPTQAAATLRVLAEAVEYAHELNVLHLDLKPANVLVNADNRLFIADFGLARPLDAALASEIDEISGTPSYMAPEQIEIRRHRLSRATDIYGLGAMLYELLSGRPPFRGSDANDTLRKVLQDAPAPLRAQVPGLSRDLEAICLKCLAKEPAQRYASARALALDLGRYLDGHPISIRQPSLLERLQRWRQQHALSLGAMAGLFVLLVGGLVGFAWLYFSGEQRLERQQEITAEVAHALASPLPSPRERGRAFLGDALVDVDIADSDVGAHMALAQQAMSATGDPGLRHDAQVTLAYARASALWADALEHRGTPTALLASTNFSSPGEKPEDEGKRVFSAITRAVAAAPDDPVLLSAAAAWCRGFSLLPACPLTRIRARLKALEPDNSFRWAVGAPVGYDEAARRARLGKEAGEWTGRALVYRNHEREWLRRVVAELDAVAPGVLKQSGVGGVSARELATYTAVADLNLGFVSETQASLDGLSQYCDATTPDANRAFVCDAFEKALEAGGDSHYERAYLARWRSLREGVHPPKEPTPAERWQRSQAALLRKLDARYDTERVYLRDLVSLGLGPAREALLRRHGVPLEPPPK